jgi:maltose/moltooligosaccharide transporter
MDGSRSALGLRCGNNTAMEPYRAFIADTLNLLNSLQVFKLKVLHWFWANFGKCFTIPFPLVLLVQLEITNLVLPRFFLVQFVPSDLFGGVLILPRDPPTEEELRKIEAMGFLHHLLIYFLQLRTCQSDVAASIGLFVWYALFCYWQNSSKVLRCLFGIQLLKDMKLYGKP